MFVPVLCLIAVLMKAVNYVIWDSRLSRATQDYLGHHYTTILALVPIL